MNGLRGLFLVSLLIVGLHSLSYCRDYERDFECRPRVSFSEVEGIASKYIDEIRGIKLKKRRNKDSCYYVVSGKRGKITIDADSGEVISFKRYKGK
ncbi:MAG: hypothetical protein ACPLSJ_02795 [Thermosulfidibacteraceae bacterium]|jgi:hypothetical protein